jgi:hypothetical protein
MKRLAAVLAATVVAVSVAAGIAYSAKPNPGFPNKDMVFGGGHFVFAGNSHTFSVSGVAGTGTLVYSTGSMVARFSCVTVTGNVAVVGGFVTSSTFAANVGLPVEMYFVDNGQPAGSTVGGDEVSPILIGGNLTGTCPAVVDASQAPELDAVDAGDVTVHAAGT